MLPPLRRLAGLFALLGSTTFAQLVTTNLALDFHAGADPQGDAVWTDGALGVETLAFASAPVRSAIPTAGSAYPALSVGYATPASGLNGYFDVGSPVRSTVSGTFELWLNVTSTTAGADQVIFEAGGADRGVSFTLSDATLSFNVDGALTTDLTISHPLTPGLRHVVGVIVCSNDNTANDSMFLYVDGVLVGSQNGVRIDDWAGGNLSGVGAAGGGSATGVITPAPFHGQVASLRYYRAALSAAQVTQNNAYFRERIATYVTGQSSSTNYAVTSGTGFTPTRTRTIGGVLYGFNHVVSDGTDGLVASQFLRWDLYSSADNGSTWTFLKTILDRTHPDFTNTTFQSVQLTVTPAGFVGMYMKNLYAVTPAGATDNRKFLTCLFSETPNGTYRVAFNERPFGEPSGDLGNVTSGGQLFIVSANTTDGFINIFNVGQRGDSLVAFTLHKQWLLPDNSIDHREAPSLFFQNGYWFMTTSGRTGWRPNQHKYSYATSLSGPWSPLINLGDATGYHSQLFFVATAGSSRIFSATRNAPQWGGEAGSQPVWLPLQFNRVPDILATNYYDTVTVNYTTGSVEGFHFDRGRQIPVTKARLVGATDNIDAIVDGDESTSWSNGAVITKRTVDLELGSTHLVKALKIKPLDEWRWTYKVKIYVGDGTNFTQVFPKSDEPPIIPNYAFLGPIDVTPTSGSVVRIENYASYQEGTSNNRFGLYEVQVWGGTSSAGAELNETFATYPSAWVTSAEPGTSASVVTLPGDSSPSLKLTDNSATSRVQVSKNFSGQNGAMVVVEWKYRTDTARTGEFLRLFQGSTIALDLVSSQSLAANAGFTSLALTDNAGAETGVRQITTGAWHVFRLEVNTDTDTFDLYIDGQLAWLGGKLRNPVTRLDKIMVGTTPAAVNVTAYFDDIKVDGPNPAGSTAALDQTEQLQQQVADLQNQTSAQQASLTALQAEFSALETDYATLNSLYQTRTAEAAALRTSLDAALAEAATLRTALSSAQTENATLRASLTTAQAEITTLRTALTAAQTEVAQLRTSLATAESALTTAQTLIQGLQASLLAANAQVAALTAEKAQLTAALAEATSTNGALTTQVTALSGQLTAIATVLGSDSGQSGFQLPGATPEAQLTALAAAIDSLNHGQKQALFKALGGKP